MRYTLRNAPSYLDEAFRAREEGKSLDEVILDALVRGLALAGEPIKHRDLSDVVGSWVDDPEIDEALQDQRLF